MNVKHHAIRRSVWFLDDYGQKNPKSLQTIGEGE